MEQLLDTTAIQGASFSADESRLLFSSNRTGIWNAYTIPVAGGPWTMVTKSTSDSTYAVSFFPHDNRVLLTRDQGGNELNHLYVLAEDGSERDLTPGDRLRAQFGGWTPDGSAFYVISNERDPRFFDIYRYDARTYARTMFFENTDGYLPAEVSGDGNWVALSRVTTTNDSDVYLWNASSKATRHITKHSGSAIYQPAGFDRASKYLYFVTDAAGEFQSLNRYSLSGGTTDVVHSAQWDVVSSTFSHNGKYRATIVNADGRPVVSVVDEATGAQVLLPSVPNAGVTFVRFARSETKAALLVSGDRSPSNLYVLDVATRKLTKLTDSLSPRIDAGDLVDGQVVRFTARDGTTIPNVLWKPHQATAARRAPALVWVHGGPGGQTVPEYSPVIQYLVNHGYVVLGINNRGSSGYGKTFFAADDKRHGREPLWDCVDAKKYLQSLEYVDPERIGIIGGSYGGYMVLAALAFQPDEFQVGVDIFGVSNWIRTLESMPSWWEAQRTALYAEMGDPVKDRRMLEEVSPLLHADRIRRPLIVLQGANDPRVLKVESDEVVAAVKENGVTSEYGVPRVPRRGAWLHEEGEPDSRVHRRAPVSGSAPEGSALTTPCPSTPRARAAPAWQARAQVAVCASRSPARRPAPAREASPPRIWRRQASGRSAGRIG
jgi:dipeptidyl aminopeptidase/acylaminoacyl peptidase